MQWITKNEVIVQYNIKKDLYKMCYITPTFHHFVVCLCHALLLISMHRALLAGEFSEISCFQSNVNV